MYVCIKLINNFNDILKNIMYKYMLIIISNHVIIYQSIDINFKKHNMSSTICGILNKIKRLILKKSYKINLFYIKLSS